ncbi:MAG: N-6 DNA methylase [Euryarchaeota archaeon]|nr:N-6 DNA methylase [Euryarchaeota archaeon]
MIDKKFILGQYWTRKEIVKKVINLILKYKRYDKKIWILEPSFGTGNFIQILRDRGFTNIEGCEIDPQWTKKPSDFFLYPIDKKFDLIIGNPPFTKYNIKGSYYYQKKYFLSATHPGKYLTKKLVKKEKMQIESAFILKAIKHLKDENSSIGFVLPISFFIKGKNLEIKKEILNRFSTIIVYQNDRKWVDEPIPCCFAIFTNVESFRDKVVLLYEDGGEVEEVLDKSDLLTEELIPKSFLYKKNNNLKGTPISEFLLYKRVKYKKSYKENNISGANIVEKIQIPKCETVSDYYLAVVRVGNASVGRAGLIDIQKDILNDMFYVFEFKEKYNQNRELKEKICRILNKNQEHFKNSTFRVGSKSIKKSDILDFKFQS